MEIKFLGTGGAFEPEYGNASAIVQCHGKKFLIDCGFTIYKRLKELNLFNEIDYILITHLHNDHTGSLASLLLHYNLVSSPGKKMKLVYPSKKFRNQIRGFLAYALVKPDRYIDWVSINDIEGVFAIDTFGRHVKKYQTYGYYFREGEQVIAYSGDIGDEDFIFRELGKKKVRKATVYHEIVFSRLNGHSYYQALIPHLKDFPIYAYHCDPGNNKEDNIIPLVIGEKELCY